MTDSETHELIGRKREEYRKAKRERAAIQAKLGELAKYAETIQSGLLFPDRVIWWDGTPTIGRSPNHITLTAAMFQELSESNVRHLVGDLKQKGIAIASLRTELTALEGEDPEKS